MSTSYSTPSEQRQGVSVPHLVMGLVFLGLAGAWLLHQVGIIGSVQVEWLLPLVLVVAGAAGLLASLTRGITRGSREPHDSTDDSTHEETFVTDETTP